MELLNATDAEPPSQFACGEHKELRVPEPDSDEPIKTSVQVAHLYQTLTWSFPLESVLILNQKMPEARGKLLSFASPLWIEMIQ